MHSKLEVGNALKFVNEYFIKGFYRCTIQVVKRGYEQAM